MKVCLYRYPHPTEANKFLYSGQESRVNRPRDREHRSGRTSFGRRFKKLFPGVELPQPVKEIVEVENQLELNELETAWMFRYHTWWGYEDGMNLTLPGSQDYKALSELGSSMGGKNQPHEAKVRGGRLGGLIGGRIGGLLGSRELKVRAGRIGGLRGSRSSKILAARAAGRKAVDSGQLDAIQNLPQTIKARRENGQITACLRWNICRGKSCVCGKH